MSQENIPSEDSGDTPPTWLAANWFVERRGEQVRKLEEVAALVKQQTTGATDDVSGDLLNDFSEALKGIEVVVRKFGDLNRRYRPADDDEIRSLSERLDSIISMFSLRTVVENSRRLDIDDQQLNEHNSQLVDHNSRLDDRSSRLVDHASRLEDHNSQFDHQDSRLVLLERWRDGSVSFQLPADIPLMEMPPKPAVFYGRDELVESIVERLCSNDNCHIPVLGPGGIGKTTLAAAVINDERIAAKFGANRFFVNCEKVTNCDELAGKIAPGLHLHPNTNPRQAVSAHLASFKCAFLVLDNAETLLDSEDRDAVENWPGTVAQNSHVSVMITMRGTNPPGPVRWADICRLPLPPLSLSSTRQIWPDTTSSIDDNLDTLLGMLDGMPLAVRLMATVDPAATPSQLIQWYEEEKTSLLGINGDTHLTSLEVSIRLSLNSRIMVKHPEAVNMLPILCILPDGMLRSSITDAFTSMSSPKTNSLILERSGLAIREKDRIRCLAPVREFILQNHSPMPLYLADIRLFFMQITDQVGKLGHKRSAEAIEQLCAEFANITSILKHFWIERSTVDIALDSRTALTEATIQLSEFSIFFTFGDCSDLLRRSAQQLDVEGDHANAAKCIKTLGHHLESRYEYSHALERFEEARTRYRRIGDRHGAAQCTQSIGNVLHRQKKNADAFSSLQEARTEFSALGDRLGTAQSSKRIGEVLYSQARYPEATVSLREARSEFQASRDPIGAPQSAKVLGSAKTSTGMPVPA
ncbi:hypothetical protein DACRYDRAFT_115704 [Dacryopinax primogenitus]|uniref:Novel STAND NTPase 1 domain-containing protein n=1 Tax=Dacryopinax primogenitus (strain DJM 731) TaxID=1858805 RepID=M5G1W8_DACPD|nr:uncharacterized protein DACRYDRAFT_115704 [Dacryopinax primogenitus]EJU02684.1 hypothetical protein DACRYDRAFT_115704 [Dacryopinax primogenitus]